MRVGPDAYVIDLKELSGMNMTTGRVPSGEGERKPVVQRSTRVFFESDKPVQFPLKAAYDRVHRQVHMPDEKVPEVDPADDVDKQERDQPPDEDKPDTDESDLKPDTPYVLGEGTEGPSGSATKIASYERVDKTKNFVLSRPTAGPRPGAILARTVVNMDQGDVHE